MKVFLALLVVLVSLPVVFYVTVSLLWGVPRYRGPITDHFDGHLFHNLEGAAPHRGLGTYLWMRVTSKFKRQHRPMPPEWPEWIEAAPGPRPPERVEGLRVTFINHATLLIQMEGINLLTDPQWSERASPVSFAGPKRHRVPGVRFEDLPPIDAVLISHNHYDHMDIPTLRRLARDHQPAMFVALGNSAFLQRKGIPAGDLEWWESRPLAGRLQVTSVPAKHFSARSMNDRNRVLWGGFVVQGERASFYFAGDTGYGPHFKEIGRRYAGLTVAFLPIGAYRPSWFMKPVHVSPEEAVQAHVDVGARYGIPMHYGTFRLSEEAIDDPLKDLRAELDRRGFQAPTFVILEQGIGHVFKL